MPTTWTSSPPRNTQRYSREGDFKIYTSPPLPLSSDDEDPDYCENITRIHSGRKPEVTYDQRKTSRTRKPDAYEGYRTSRKNSSCQRESRQLSPSRPEDASEVFVTTMDEEDQQMFIALFYWRRKVIETHFSAWKWVIFTLRRSAKQIRRRGTDTQPRKVFSIAPTRRNLILKRHTGQLSAEEPVKSQIGSDDEKPVHALKRSLPDINVQGLKARVSTTRTNDNLLEVTSGDKRRQFKAELRLVYACYDQWKSTVDESRTKRVHQLVRATNFHHDQQLKSALRSWRYGTKMCKQKRNRLGIAENFRCNRSKRFVIGEWKRYCRVEHEIARRRNIQAAQLKRISFRHWYQCIKQTRNCQNLAAKRSRNHLRVSFRHFRVGVLHARRACRKWDVAISHCQARQQLKLFHLWRKAVFEDPSYLLPIDHGVRISLLTGVRKWRRFLEEKQQASRNILLADFFRYRASQKRAFRGWGHFLEWKRERNLLYVEVARHHQRSLKREGIRKLRAAACANRLQRDQVRMATQWHQKKLLIGLLGQWNTNARRCGRVRSFRIGVTSRRLNFVFQSWHEQRITFRNLRLKQLTVSRHWDEYVLRSSMVKWVRLLRTNSFISSLDLKRHNASVASHFRAWHTWSTNKVSLQTIVKQQRQRSEDAMLQRVVSKWFGVTLRKRCIKRLVKLFRKKQARHRVKSIFRLWRVHAHICTATRSRGRDQARLHLVEWKRVCRQLRERRMGLAVASQYFRERRYALALELWTSFTGQRVHARKSHRKALSHYFQKILVSSLQRWYIVTRNLRRQAEFLHHCQQLRDEKILKSCLHGWYAILRQQIRSRAQEWTALQFYVDILQRRSFYAWQDFLQARRVSSENMYVAAAAYETKLQANVFQRWRFVIQEMSWRKVRCLQARNAVEQRRLQASVTRWFKYRCERRRRRKQQTTAETFYNQYLLCFTLYHWQELWFKASMIRKKGREADRRVNALRLARAVSAWHENYQHSSNIQRQKLKATRFYTKSMLATHFQLWRCYHNAVRHKLSKRRLVNQRRNQNILCRMFRRWCQYSKDKTLAKLQNLRALQHRTASVFRLVLHKWKTYRSKRTLLLMAYFHRRKFVLQKVWATWKSHLESVAKVRRNILATTQLLRSNLFRATFVRWKLYTAQRVNHRIELDRSDDHHVRWWYKQAVARWRKQIRFQHAAFHAASLGQTNGTRHFWRRWRCYVAVKRDRKRKRGLAERTYHQNRQRRHFTVWKTRTQRCVQGRQEKSDALYRVSCLRMVWSKWHRVIRWRKCIDTIESRRFNYWQAEMLRRWRAYTSDRIEKKVNMKVSISFQQRRVRAKTWRSWLLYITRCHEKQEQLVWVLSYYSVEVLLRQSIASWKKLVAIQNKQRENNEIADLFNTHRLVCECYRRWRTFINFRKVKLGQMESLQRKCEMLVLSRSVRRWRNRSTSWHHQHKCETMAAHFFSRRRLECGLNTLIRWKESEKNIRELTIRAKHFRNGKALGKSFRCWQRYHQWRAKHAHLVRIFKQNQKEDVFARWKRYWQNQHSMNEKRLQARVFHCIHVEQRVLSTWRVLVRVQKQKKSARSFNTTKVLCRNFSFWKRRVHVLRQMRKMFLYQESFRAQTHFDAWKRYVVARKQMSGRLRKAMRFRDNLCKVYVWQKWSSRVFTKRQVRETIKLALAFRQRFSFRKRFAEWRKRAAYWKLKRALTIQALHHYQTRLVCRSFHSFIARRQSRLALLRLEKELAFVLVVERKRRVISNLLSLCAETKRKRELIRQACSHWQFCHQQKYWGRILLWFSLAQHQKQQRIQADALARAHVLKRCITAIQTCIFHRQQVRTRVNLFRCRYFRSVADDCFYQWKAFITFKQKLRDLRRKNLQSQRRQRLHQWHVITAEQVRRREGIQEMAIHRRERELERWFHHWESVCTDLWIDKELVAHHHRHAQKRRRLRFGLKMLQDQLPTRHERQKCKRFFLLHHRVWLRQVLQLWHQVNTAKALTDEGDKGVQI